MKKISEFFPNKRKIKISKNNIRSNLIELFENKANK